jgi:hypothetical protein
VSFGTYARKVRDPGLPYGRRIQALAGCVQRYRPLGYQATFDYLTRVAGPLRHDEAALLRALDSISASRELWQRELLEYADRRRAAKRSGRRRPRTTESNPSRPTHWYGDSQRAARFALDFLLRNSSRAAEADPEVVRFAAAVLADPSPVLPAEMRTLRQRYERIRAAASWPNGDHLERYRADRSLWVLDQLSDTVRPR